ncbi:MAG: chromosomal replication initiator protein DnaA [Oscillospiraceae bacterium]
MTSFSAVFESVKKYILEAELITSVGYNSWIKGLTAVDLEDGSVAVLGINHEFARDIVERNYTDVLEKGFSDVMGFPVTVKIIVQEDLRNEMYAAERSKAEMENIFEGAKYEYTFDTFIVGRSNEFAYAACTAVAGSKSSSPIYNPLFIYGPSGLGKTHLLTAIAHEFKKNQPYANIIYVTGEAFANELIGSIHQKKDTSQFHQKYRSADILLVDDIQFIAGKESTQEEFFHTFNDLYKMGKQIVLTSDRPPKDIKTLEDRIRTRCEWGLIADISVPDFETRMAIIKRKAELLQLVIPDEVAEYIANKLKTNIRQLEGAVKKLKASKHLLGTQITLSMAQSVIKDILTDSQPIPITVENIITEVANVYNVTSDDIRSNKRQQQISVARKVSIYCIREITGLSQEAIGRELGGRDHSTITYSLNNIEEALKKDQHLKESVDDIIKNIRDK